MCYYILNLVQKLLTDSLVKNASTIDLAWSLPTIASVWPAISSKITEMILKIELVCEKK